MFTFDDLNPFSRRFAERLLTVYPEWRPLAQIPTAAEFGDGTLSVCVRSPLADRELWIATFGDEVTVGFGEHGWHAHYFPWDEAPESVVFDRALEDIAAILAEDLAILTRFAQDEVRSSETFYADEEVKWKSADRIEITSWLGNRDATLFPA